MSQLSDNQSYPDPSMQSEFLDEKGVPLYNTN